MHSPSHKRPLASPQPQLSDDTNRQSFRWREFMFLWVLWNTQQLHCKSETRCRGANVYGAVGCITTCLQHPRHPNYLQSTDTVSVYEGIDIGLLFLEAAITRQHSLNNMIAGMGCGHLQVTVNEWHLYHLTSLSGRHPHIVVSTRKWGDWRHCSISGKGKGSSSQISNIQPGTHSYNSDQEVPMQQTKRIEQ